MFLGNSEIELEGGFLRSGRIFWSGKRRSIVTRRVSCSTTGGEEYELASQFDKGSYDKEEEYHPIPEKEDKEEAPYLEYGYGIPTTPCPYP